MDNQRCVELGNLVPGEEGAGTADSNAGGQMHSICYGLLKVGRVGGEGGNRNTVD